jgi:anaerobic selenocysteine-containing dehydrogenase
LSAQQIENLARKVSQPGKRVSWWWTMGVNQSHEGVRTAQAIINHCLITGNIGKPGTGLSSITGQCNAMGSRIFSNTTSLVGGHDFQDPVHRKKVAAGLGIPLDVIPTDTSLAYDQILAAADAGTSKAVRKAPGQALSDFRIFRLIADACGCGGVFAKWTSPEAVFKLIRDRTRDRPCDITGISDYAMIDELGGIQWPFPSGRAGSGSLSGPHGPARADLHTDALPRTQRPHPLKLHPPTHASRTIRFAPWRFRKSPEFPKKRSRKATLSKTERLTGGAWGY